MLMCHRTLDTMICKKLTCLVCICTGERKSWPTPDCSQSSFKSSFKSSFGLSLLLCSMSSVLSPFIVVLNALAFGCILNFWLTVYTLTRYRN